MIKANAGDLIFAHYLLYHDACVNISPNVRHAAIARLRHKDIDLIGNDAYTQIWREWTGVPQT